MFEGLSAFPLTPLVQGEIDEKAFISLITNLATAGVNSIGALGSTGSYAYLTIEQRARAARLAVENADGIPVMVGIGAIRYEDVLQVTEDAQNAGVSAVMLAPVSYQKPTDEEVYALYENVSKYLSVPLCLYDNPATTGFQFSDELLIEVANLPSIGSIKLTRLPEDIPTATERVSLLRQRLPVNISIGIGGDWRAATGLSAGCHVWYSTFGGLFPRTALDIVNAVQSGDIKRAEMLSGALEPLWQLFRAYGSIRVTASIAELFNYAKSPCLPFPLSSLTGDALHHLELIQEDLRNLQ
ncbi:dihydrodipicolinate synthase family protein [Xenorhabdus sp. 12]|uniref:Dihydrodipicolinate synthase family protein n=1 Tax=Xenorhabdus santafensis TaxID=2582833 RepID=A0ABU4S879_9GAMM|nr:dihydrodipicolinate synthase family protein [Xenorhabdus sp. 12]MDX7986984.1 dihydrodipicolinate synthase family protein [Xenorhabdus sp. 12]